MYLTRKPYIIYRVIYRLISTALVREKYSENPEHPSRFKRKTPYNTRLWRKPIRHGEAKWTKTRSWCSHAYDFECCWTFQQNINYCKLYLKSWIYEVIMWFGRIADEEKCVSGWPPGERRSAGEQAFVVSPAGEDGVSGGSGCSGALSRQTFSTHRHQYFSSVSQGFHKFQIKVC